MRGIQCWAQLPDGTRCGCQVLPGRNFCAQHGRMGCHRDPALIFRAPIAEMPPDLVDLIRAAAPDIVFPEPPPASLAPPVSAAASPAAPTPPPGTGSLDGTVDAASSPTLVEEPEAEAPMPAFSVPAPEEDPQPQLDPRGTPASAAHPASVLPKVRENDRSDECNGESLDWLLGVLKEVVLGVVACDSPPLQKANAVARLGNLYLKADRAAELKRENALLRKRLVELEQRLPAVETPHSASDADVGPPPREARPVHPGAPAENSRPGLASSPSGAGRNSSKGEEQRREVTAASGSRAQTTVASGKKQRRRP
jgi:hypothetical protein